MSASAEFNNCTLDTCPITGTVLQYRPSLAANTILLVLFTISLVAHAAQGWRWRTKGFAISMILGCLCEVIGYIGRIMSWNDPFGQTGFLTQIVCLTLAPAFFGAGIYLCISKIVSTLGPQISRISPRSYMLIFIPCDIISLTLQGAGGGYSSVLSQDGKDPKVGSNVMIAGLSFQVFTLALFMTLCVEYGFRYRRASRSQRADLVVSRSALGSRFYIFMAVLALATLCIFIRSVYRVIELSEGWDGDLVHDQTLFIVLEGVMVIIAVLALNVGHPGWALGTLYAAKADEKRESNV